MGLCERGDAFLAFAKQLVRDDYHSAPIANQGLLVFEFLQLHRGSLTRGADQIRQILVRKFQRQQHAARVLDTEFGADFEQRASQTLPQSQSHEVCVANQHHPPSPHRYIKYAAQKFALNAEGGFDEHLGLHDGDRAIGERVASKRPDRIR